MKYFYTPCRSLMHELLVIVFEFHFISCCYFYYSFDWNSSEFLIDVGRYKQRKKFVFLFKWTSYILNQIGKSLYSDYSVLQEPEQINPIWSFVTLIISLKFNQFSRTWKKDRDLIWQLSFTSWNSFIISNKKFHKQDLT